jgi:hypothetical protein
LFPVTGQLTLFLFRGTVSPYFIPVFKKSDINKIK